MSTAPSGRIPVTEKLIREVHHQLTTHRYDPHYDHPTNQTISALIDAEQNEELLLLIIANYEAPSRLASILQSMRFASLDKLTENHYCLLRRLLWRDNTIVRAAVVELLEHWNTELALKQLKDHVQFEKVAWLADYIRKVLHETSS